MMGIRTIKNKKGLINMKIKEHKTQILSALALAFMLGLAVPGAVFAEGGDTEAGISAQAESGDKTDDKKVMDLPESVATLYGRIKDGGSFKDYLSMKALIENTVKIQKSALLSNATDWANNTECTSASGTAGKVSTWISTETKDALKDKKVYEVLTVLKSDAIYDTNTAYKKIVDGLNTNYTTWNPIEIAQLKLAAPEVTGIDGMSLQKLVEVAVGLPKYEKSATLITSMEFLENAIQTDGTVSVKALEALYKDEDDLMLHYANMLNAAVAIDKDVADGLFQLPKTSAPTAPGTGILDWIENGAMDLSTLILVVSVAVASVAGLAILVRLYTKKKF